MKLPAMALLVVAAGILMVRAVYPVLASPPAQEEPPAVVTGEPTTVPNSEVGQPESSRSPQLDVAPSDVTANPDGSLVIPDRGDGCEYREIKRSEAQLDLKDDGNRSTEEIVVLQDLECDVFYWFIPSTGGIIALIAVGAP